MKRVWDRRGVGRAALALAAVLLASLAARQPAAVRAADYQVQSFDIASEASAELRPRISGTTVVYQVGGSGENADGNIRRTDFAEDNDDGEQVNEGTNNSKRPDVDGDVIVWTQDGGADGFDIHGYDIGDDDYFTVAASTNDEDFAAVSGNIVVYEDRDGANTILSGYRIDDDEHFTVANHDAGQFDPAIDGDLVAWVDIRDGGDEPNIFARDLGSGDTFRVTDSGQALEPAVSGNRIVYSQGDDQDKGIYVYDRTDGSRRRISSTSEGLRRWPRIDGDIVVWMDEREGPGRQDIYGYDFSTNQEFVVDDQSDDQEFPDVSVGSINIVWRDESNSGDIRGGIVEVSGLEEPSAEATPTQAQPTVGAGPPAPRDDRFYFQTGFRIDHDVINDFFLSRGGVNTFGFPISRTFLFRGVVVQFFQRHIIEIGPNGAARLPNLLDPGLMPVDQINFSRYPSVDNALKAQTPPATDLPALISFIQQKAPEEFGNRPVRFFSTFSGFVTCESAFRAAPCQPNFLPGFNLEVVGSVTSAPQSDPGNPNFIYQRFQRTILHYDVGCNCTQALLLASYFADVLKGTAPPDLMASMAGTPYISQYNNGAPLGLNRPAELPDTNLQNAFQQQ